MTQKALGIITQVSDLFTNAPTAYSVTLGLIFGGWITYRFQLERRKLDEDQRRKNAMRNTRFTFDIHKLVLETLKSECLDKHSKAKDRHHLINVEPDNESYASVPLTELMFLLDKNSGLLKEIHYAEFNYKAVVRTWKKCNGLRQKAHESKDKNGIITDHNAEVWLKESTDILYDVVPECIAQLKDILGKIESVKI